MDQIKEKWIYTFGDGEAEGNRTLSAVLGGKGAALAEMARLGLPVPPGFTVPATVCNLYYASGRQLPEALADGIAGGIAHLEAVTGRSLGSRNRPLLVSVRSGAQASMPGMMDTVLNLGLNDETVEGLAEESGDERFAYDSYRRFIQMYGDVVMGLDHEVFEEILDTTKERLGFANDTDLAASHWKDIVQSYKNLIREELETSFPQDPADQLKGAVAAVFSSWMSQRAIIYRKLHNIADNLGTAVNVQAMVFGNTGSDSATGVAFTRNPSTGESTLYGEFLVNAQGEDVVAGIRTPQDITEAARIASGSDKPSLEKLMPEAFAGLLAIARRLEAHYQDMQDLEFTIERGKLWILQTRTAKRTARAALRIAVDMCEEGVLSREDALLQIDASSLDHLLHPTIADHVERTVIASGLPASPGAATGRIVFNPDEAAEQAEQGEDLILVRIETSPEDIHGMHAAKGILTQRGGMTSHAAVVARGMGKPCIAGAGTIRIDYRKGEMKVGNRIFTAGEIITLDGATGQVLEGAVEMQQPELSGAFGTIMEWADGIRRMGIRSNAETPKDARAARSFGAEGIGLCRTEHMFFDDERIAAMREMIIASTLEERRLALAKLLPVQRSDFEELFEIMAGQPVTIRLLDPPLHEFLPHGEEDIRHVAEIMGIDAETLKAREAELHEFNPMLGHRGCRLAISHPEIAQMQARAIFEAAIAAGKRAGSTVVPEIMVPVVGMKREIDHVKAIIDGVASQVAAETGETIEYRVGTMIELPRAAIRAGDIAEAAEFFSFGTNDLTQTVFGISRDDASQFLRTYESEGVIDRDPFISLDLDGVGDLMRIATERGRATRPDLPVGICGEHGGDPASIAFCEELGLDYVSCSPFRVPIARLAAAQAHVRARRRAGEPG